METYQSYQKIDNTKFGTIKNCIFCIQVKNQYPTANKNLTQNISSFHSNFSEKGIWGWKR